ncbi:hypothetical protein Hte_000283 [Hypoxylon texense]
MALTFINDEARSLFIFSIAMGILCSIATALRFVSTLNSNRKVGLEDWFALGALVSYLAYIACDLTALGILSGKDLETISPDEFSALGKALFATVPFFPVNQLCAKFSILFLYYRLFSVNRSFVRWTYVIGSIQILCSTATLFINIFSCMPINYNWDVDVEGYCLDQGAIFAGTESVNSALDLSMVALAILMVHELRLRLSTKLKLAFIFALGSLSGVIGYVRIAEFYLEATPDSVGGAFYTRIISHVGSFNWRRPSVSWESGSKGFPSSSTGDQSHPSVDTYGASRPTQRRQQWLSLSNSSQNGPTWVEMEADPNHANARGAGDAMKTAQLEERFQSA